MKRQQGILLFFGTARKVKYPFILLKVFTELLLQWCVHTCVEGISLISTTPLLSICTCTVLAHAGVYAENTFLCACWACLFVSCSYVAWCRKAMRTSCKRSAACWPSYTVPKAGDHGALWGRDRRHSVESWCTIRLTSELLFYGGNAT